MIVENIFDGVGYLLETVSERIRDVIDDFGYEATRYFNEHFDLNKIERITTMEHDEWYTHLKPEELCGKHVQAISTDVTIDGCLNEHGQITYRNNKNELEYIQVFLYSAGKYGGKIWHPIDWFYRVNLVWDERYWLRINLDHAVKNNVLVINGELYRLKNIDVHDDGTSTWHVIAKNDSIISVHEDMISDALTYKNSLPEETGVYTADNCRYLILTNDGIGGKDWIVIDDDYNFSLYTYDNLNIKYWTKIRKA